MSQQLSSSWNLIRIFFVLLFTNNNNALLWVGEREKRKKFSFYFEKLRKSRARTCCAICFAPHSQQLFSFMSPSPIECEFKILRVFIRLMMFVVIKSEWERERQFKRLIRHAYRNEMYEKFSFRDKIKS